MSMLKGLRDMDLRWFTSLVVNEEDFVLELKEKGELSIYNLTKFIYLAMYKNIKYDTEVRGLSQEEVFKKYRLLEIGVTSKNTGAVGSRPLEKLNESTSYRMFKKEFMDKYESQLIEMKNVDDVFKFIIYNYKNSSEFSRLRLCL